MTTEKLFSLFVSRSTKVLKDGSRVTTKSFKDQYGDVSVEYAFEHFELPRIRQIESSTNKYKALQHFFFCEKLSGRATMVQSNQSESEYYKWNGYEFRFSQHRYPTGSMTNDFLNIIDMTDEGAVDMVISKFKIYLDL